VVGHFTVSCADRLVHVALHMQFNVRVKLEDLLICLRVNFVGVEEFLEEIVISDLMNRTFLAVVLILKESIVTFTVASGHLDLSHTSSIGHIADHSRVNKVHQILRVVNSITVEDISLVIIVAVLRHMKLWVKQNLNKLVIV